MKPKEQSISKSLEELGAVLWSKKLESSVMAIVSCKVDFEDKKQRKLKDAEKLEIHVVTEEFVNAIQTTPSADVATLLGQYAIFTPSGADLTKKIATANVTKSAKELKEEREEQMYAMSSKSAKLKVKGGGAVEPDSGKFQAFIYSQRSNEILCGPFRARGSCSGL